MQTQNDYDPFNDPDDGEYAKAFEYPGLWASSELYKDVDRDGMLFRFDPVVPHQLQEVPPLKDAGPEFLFERIKWDASESLFKLPEGLSFNQESLALETPELTSRETEPTASSESDAPGKPEDDIWMNPACLKPSRPPKYHTWDSFFDKRVANEPNSYLSEAGVETFDQALRLHLNDAYSENAAGDVIRSDVYCFCALQMAMGLDSIVFKYDTKDSHFRPVRKNMRLSGLTVQTTESVTRIFSLCGDNIRFLQRFVERSYSTANKTTPTLMALASCSISIVTAIRTALDTPPSKIYSFLQLRSLCEEPLQVLTVLVKTISLISKEKDDSKALSTLFTYVQQNEHNDGWIRPLLIKIFNRASGPWRSFVEEWMGFREEAGLIAMSEGAKRPYSFVAVNEENLEHEVDGKMVPHTEYYYALEKTSIPEFLSVEEASVIFETGRSLRYLAEYHPKHPFCSPAMYNIETPSLSWSFNWDGIEKTHTKAKEYEESLRAAIQKYQNNTDRGGQERSKEEDSEAHPIVEGSELEFAAIQELQNSLKAMEADLPPIESGEDLYNLVLSVCKGQFDEDGSSVFAPPFGILPALSFSSIFQVQHKLINSVCLRIFFEEHHIDQHLALLRRFFLFEDGVYTSRLAHALFDDDAESSEHRVRFKAAGSMGLKLGFRDTWPPASYEVRLALSDILSDCYEGTNSVLKDTTAQRTVDGSLRTARELPGGLNFAIRDMTEEELEKCMNPNSIEALDFLKLHYRPNKPLDAVITPLSLRMYDRLFMLHLRVSRILSISTQLARDAFISRNQAPAHPLLQKFRIEARHFITNFAQYLTVTAVGQHWSTFMSTVDLISSQLKSDTEPTISIDRLRHFHEKTLERMLTATFLRKRQKPILNYLEKIFESTILLARKSRPGGEYETNLNELKKDYRRFKKDVGTFITVLIMMRREAKEGKKEDGEHEGGVFGQLLIRLDMLGYFTAKK